MDPTEKCRRFGVLPVLGALLMLQACAPSISLENGVYYDGSGKRLATAEEVGAKVMERCEARQGLHYEQLHDIANSVVPGGYDDFTPSLRANLIAARHRHGADRMAMLFCQVDAHAIATGELRLIDARGHFDRSGPASRFKFACLVEAAAQAELPDYRSCGRG